MKVLISCEFSGIVRNAFIERGHEAISCDLMPSEDWPIAGLHILGNVLHRFHDRKWDLMIAFPPCTYLASSGARWWKGRKAEQVGALYFVQMLFDAPIPKIALENPIGRISTAIRKPDQIIQPWQFGHPEVKATCLWLKNLPKLKPTSIVKGREQRIWRMSPSPNRTKDRSRTYTGIAKAMAEQWG